MKHTIFILLTICLNIGITAGQGRIPEIKQFKHVDSPEFDYYFQISEKPVTNLDYLTYLCWINDVYSDYPDVLINALPILNPDSLSTKQRKEIEDYFNRFQKLIEISNSEYTNRLFDFNYINYPVIGLSKSQIFAFGKWLTDRYNENYAIDKKVFQWDPNQIGSENFTTESYLNGQYDGLVNKNIRDKTTKQYRRINWSDNYFIPTFRLPTDKELMLVSLQLEMKEYNGFTFIKKWTDFYISYNQNGLTIKRKDISKALLADFKIASKIAIDVKTKITEYAIQTNSVQEQEKLQSIYQILGQSVIDKNSLLSVQKDSLGRYPFQIIGTKENEPLYANPPVANDIENAFIFRLVINESK